MSEEEPKTESDLPDPIQPFIDTLNKLAGENWMSAMRLCLKVLHRPEMRWGRTETPPDFSGRPACLVFESLEGRDLHHYSAYGGPTSAERACALSWVLANADLLLDFLKPWAELPDHFRKGTTLRTTVHVLTSEDEP